MCSWKFTSTHVCNLIVAIIAECTLCLAPKGCSASFLLCRHGILLMFGSFFRLIYIRWFRAAHYSWAWRCYGGWMVVLSWQWWDVILVIDAQGDVGDWQPLASWTSRSAKFSAAPVNGRHLFIIYPAMDMCTACWPQIRIALAAFTSSCNLPNECSPRNCLC